MQVLGGAGIHSIPSSSLSHRSWFASSSTNGALHGEHRTILQMVPCGAGTVAAEPLFLSLRMLVKLSFNLTVAECTF